MNSGAKTTLEMANKVLENLIDMGYVVRHYDLRVKYKKSDLDLEVFDVLGKTWIIHRHLVSDFNSFVFNGNNEANIWLHKEH